MNVSTEVEYTGEEHSRLTILRTFCRELQTVPISDSAIGTCTYDL
jgi:hypothetical protein